MQKEMDVGCQGDGSRRPTEQRSIRPRPRHRFVPSTGTSSSTGAHQLRSFARVLEERESPYPRNFGCTNNCAKRNPETGDLFAKRPVNRKACIYSSSVYIGAVPIPSSVSSWIFHGRTKDVWGEKINGKLRGGLRACSYGRKDDY